MRDGGPHGGLFGGLPLAYMRNRIFVPRKVKVEVNRPCRFVLVSDSPRVVLCLARSNRPFRMEWKEASRPAD